MIPLSWRSPKTEIRASPIQGKGLFATANISRDEVVVVKGGHIVSKQFLNEKVTTALGPTELQIDDQFFITPVTRDEREGSMIYSNHSCEANLGIRGEITFVALRDIKAGEELTHDWAMTDNDSDSMQCRCGAANCRGTVTGQDWRRPELQKKYAGYFSAYLARQIAQMKTSNASFVS